MATQVFASTGLPNGRAGRPMLMRGAKVGSFKDAQCGHTKESRPTGGVVVREGEEPRRVLGRPQGGLHRDEYQLRFLQIPRNWIGPLRLHVRRVAHPVRLLRWRLQVRRLGPYAPDYDDFGDASSDL